MKYIILTLLYLLTFIYCANAQNQTLNYDDLLPNKYWKYMVGYKYDYDNPTCNVRWNKRSASFVLTGEQCTQISPSKIKEDAIKSIDFISNKMPNNYHVDFASYYAALADGSINSNEHKKDYSYPKSNRTLPSRNSNYDYIEMRWQGIGIWIQGCADYASGMSSRSSLAETYQGNRIAQRFPQLKPDLVKILYDQGWKNAVNVNFYCMNYAGLFVDELLISVNDLRK